MGHIFGYDVAADKFKDRYSSVFFVTIGWGPGFKFSFTNVVNSLVLHPNVCTIQSQTKPGGQAWICSSDTGLDGWRASRVDNTKPGHLV